MLTSFKNCPFNFNESIRIFWIFKINFIQYLLLVTKLSHVVVLNLGNLLLLSILNLNNLEITSFFFIFVSTHIKLASLRKCKGSGYINFNIVKIKFVRFILWFSPFPHNVQLNIFLNFCSNLLHVNSYQHIDLFLR